jgi:hypothetical protein
MCCCCCKLMLSYLVVCMPLLLLFIDVSHDKHAAVVASERSSMTCVCSCTITYRSIQNCCASTLQRSHSAAVPLDNQNCHHHYYCHCWYCARPLHCCNVALALSSCLCDSISRSLAATSHLCCCCCCCGSTSQAYVRNLHVSSCSSSTSSSSLFS